MSSPSLPSGSYGVVQRRENNTVTKTFYPSKHASAQNEKKRANEAFAITGNEGHKVSDVSTTTELTENVRDMMKTRNNPHATYHQLHMPYLGVDLRTYLLEQHSPNPYDVIRECAKLIHQIKLFTKNRKCHADIHNGNIMVDDRNGFTLTLIDFGFFDSYEEVAVRLLDRDIRYWFPPEVVGVLLDKQYYDPVSYNSDNSDSDTPNAITNDTRWDEYVLSLKTHYPQIDEPVMNLSSRLLDTEPFTSSITSLVNSGISPFDSEFVALYKKAITLVLPKFDQFGLAHSLHTLLHALFPENEDIHSVIAILKEMGKIDYDLRMDINKAYIEIHTILDSMKPPKTGGKRRTQRKKRSKRSKRTKKRPTRV